MLKIRRLRHAPTLFENKAFLSEIGAEDQWQKSSKSSLWTTLSVSEIYEEKAWCVLCYSRIKTPNSSSSNILNKYRALHKIITEAVLGASSMTDKKLALEGNIARKKITGVDDRIRGPTSGIAKKYHPIKDTRRRVMVVLVSASRQLQLDFMGAPELESFIDCCCGALIKIKTE